MPVRCLAVDILTAAQPDSREINALRVALSSEASSPTKVRPSLVNVEVHFLAEPELQARTAINRNSKASTARLREIEATILEGMVVILSSTQMEKTQGKSICGARARQW